MLGRRNSRAQAKVDDMPSLNNCIRFTYGHRNPLNHFNYRETRELANQLNYLDYNESLEPANWLIFLNSVESTESDKHEQYSGSPEHQHCLGSAIIPKRCIQRNQKDNAAFVHKVVKKSLYGWAILFFAQG